MPKKTNKRRGPRRRRTHDAWILIEAVRHLCSVVNLSTDGAELSLKEPEPLPKQFQLVFSGRGAPKSCELVWQRGKTAGVTFVT
jgi:hypothetical protein